MAVHSPLNAIRRRLQASRLSKKLAQAAIWPTIPATINRWTILQVEDENASFSANAQIEAGFHFVHHGDYYGGDLRSEPMSHPAAKRLIAGSPEILIRYNPSNPDQTAVLVGDNAGRLSFPVSSG